MVELNMAVYTYVNLVAANSKSQLLYYQYSRMGPQEGMCATVELIIFSKLNRQTRCPSFVIIVHSGVSSVVSPQAVSICPGEQLVLTCTANQSVILKWTIAIPEGNITHSRLVPFMGSRILRSINEIFNDTVITFEFTRTSEDGLLPLTSQLQINRVNRHIHQTLIGCVPSNESDPLVAFLVYILAGK